MSTNIKLSAVAASVPYDNVTTTLPAATVQAALDQIYALVSAGGSPQFSYKLIQTLETVTIPVNREMVVSNYIDIDGTLIIEGDLAIV